MTNRRQNSKMISKNIGTSPDNRTTSSGSDSGPAPVEAMAFETAMDELENITRMLERGDVPLQKSVALYERGQALRRHCEARLAAAQERIEQVSLNDDGKAIAATPFDSPF